jgi:hypothetical protein
MYSIEGRHAKPEIVEEYVARLMGALKIHRFTSRLVTIKFKSELPSYVQGLCEGDKDYAYIQIGKHGQSFLKQMQALAHEMVHARVAMLTTTLTLTNLGRKKHIALSVNSFSIVSPLKKWYNYEK